MTVFKTMAETQMLMFVYLLTGMILSRSGFLKEAERAGMVHLLIGVVMPCSILSPYLDGLSRQMLLSGLAAMAVSLVCCLLSWQLGRMLWRRAGEGRRQVLIYGTMLPNFGNAGLPVTQLVFGAQGVFITSMQMIPSTVIGWTVGPSIYGQKGGAAGLKRVLTNPNIIAVLFGLALTGTGLTLPLPIRRAVAGFSSMTAPLSMVLIGASLAGIHLREVLQKEVLLFCLVRLIVIPVLVLLGLRACNAPVLLRQVSMVLFAMPVANYAAIQAELYGGDYVFAAACIFLTTMLSLVTVPLLTLLL